MTKIKLKKEKIVSLLITAIILASFVFYLPSISTPADEIEEARQARIYHDFALEEAKNFGDDCYILSHVPSMYLIMERNSLQTWYGSNKKVMNDLFNKTDCIIFDDGFWCNLEPYKSSVCKHIFNEYNISVISTIEVDNHNYTFYRIT